MAKIILMFVATIVVCTTLCYTTSRVCDTIDSKFTSVNSNIDTKTEGLSKEHEKMMGVANETVKICNEIDRKVQNMSIQHDAVMDILNETRITVRDTNNKVSDTNEKITFLYNMVKNQNPDLKVATERND